MARIRSVGAAAEACESAPDEGVRRAAALSSRLDHAVVPEEELRAFDVARSFEDVDTPEALEAAGARLG